MAIRREVEIWVDVPNFERVVIQGENLPTAPALKMNVSQQILFKCHLLTDYQTYYTPTAGATWYFGINPAYTSTADDLVQVDNSGFVSTDWDDADFDNGKVCWRTDLTSTTLITHLSTEANKSYYCGLWMLPVGEKPVCLIEWSSYIYNLATYVIEPSEQEGLVPVTLDMLSGYMRKEEPLYNVRFKNEKIYVWNQDDSKWYPVGCRTIDGVTVFVPGEGVSEL